jgi:geranylgeranyl pyrophosphate synthase
MPIETSSNLKSALARVEAMLGDLTASEVPVLTETSSHIVRSGGKRLRPRVLLLSFEACGGTDVSIAIPVATGVELIHTASLVHDDINDHSDLRRGTETINARWGNTLALLTGDFIFLKVLNLVAGFNPDVIRILARACIALVEGETLQTASEGECNTTEEDYLEVVERKTASLFSACAELGSLVAGGASEQHAALRGYGYNLGVAFQIRDDVLDLIGNSDRLGKPIARDLDQQKMSLAALHAFGTADEARDALAGMERASVIETLERAGGIEYAMERSREYSELAKEQLSILPSSSAREELVTLADTAVKREA